MPAGLACRDTLRLEAGMPLYGNELTADLTPYEAGLGAVVRLDKPQFVGRDALRARSSQPVEQVRVGLVMPGRRAARTGYPVLDDEGLTIGRVTSGALSPTLGHPVAMAYVDNGSAGAGTEVVVDVRGQHVAAHVVPLPFYRRPR